MREVRLGSALGGHLRQMGLKLGDPTAYGLELGDRDVLVDRTAEVSGKKIIYTRRYFFNRPLYIPTSDDKSEFDKSRIPSGAKLYQEALKISEDDKTLFQYMIFSHQDKSSFCSREGWNVRTEEAIPKEAVREAMKILNDQSSQNQEKTPKL